MLGRMARDVLQEAKLPRHVWFETSAWELVMAALGRYRTAGKRVLNQRASLRQLHAKVLQLKGELASARICLASQQDTIRQLREQIAQHQHNR